jgi:hypothetical protein
MFAPIDLTGASEPDAACPEAARAEERFHPMVPPPGAARPEFHHPQLGTPSATWPYHNNSGLFDGHVCRFETTNPDGSPGKTFRPYRYGALTKNGQTRTRWHWRGWSSEERPLYGLADLKARADAPVLIVEGEKKVDAAKRLFPDYVPVSPMNGAESPHKTDWAPAFGCELLVWRDNDSPGREFAEAVVKLAADAGAASVAVVDIPSEWPLGWDLADEPVEGVDHDALLRMLGAARRRVLPRSSGRAKPPRTQASKDGTRPCGLMAPRGRVPKLTRPVLRPLVIDLSATQRRMRKGPSMTTAEPMREFFVSRRCPISDTSESGRAPPKSSAWASLGSTSSSE